MLYKEYPYNGKEKNQILKEIELNKELKKYDNEIK